VIYQIRNEQQISKIKSSFEVPKSVKNFISYDDINHLISIFEESSSTQDPYKGKIYKNTGPVTLDLGAYLEDSVIKEIIMHNKEWLSNKRNYDLFKFSTDEIKIIRRLENNFGKICFLPLDIPKIKNINLLEFKEWYFQTARSIIKKNPDIAGEYSGHSSFLSVDILPLNYDTQKSIWTKNIISNFKETWPDMYCQFKNNLPFVGDIKFSIWSSTRDIIPHRDLTMMIDLPLEFRILFDDNNVENLFVEESIVNELTGKKISVPNNIETNSFVWNNLRTQHYSNFYPEQKKIIFIFHWSNIIDWKAYEDLITKSLEKYKDRSLISNLSRDYFV
jgi:hypothetical protein